MREAPGKNPHLARWAGAALGNREPVDHSRSGARTESADSEWESRVQRAASADVRSMLRNTRRLRRERWLIGSVAVVAVALILVLLARIGVFDDLLPGSSAAPAPGGEESSGQASLALDLRHPYANSPAADWPDGAAGILPPSAGPVGGFTAEQVEAATRQVRDLLVASRLDRQVVVGHDPGRFLAGFAADARRQLQPLFGGGREAEVQSLVSLVADDATLLPVDPKVSGRMSVHAGGAGELVVHTNYVFVYAFHTNAPDKIVDPMDILVVVRAAVDYVLRVGNRWTPGSQGWWYGEAGGYAYSIACDAYRKGYLAPAFTERPATEISGQDRDAYFDPDRPLPEASGCPR
jgi:hypothetical protein